MNPVREVVWPCRKLRYLAPLAGRGRIASAIRVRGTFHEQVFGGSPSPAALRAATSPRKRGEVALCGPLVVIQFEPVVEIPDYQERAGLPLPQAPLVLADVRSSR